MILTEEDTSRYTAPPESREDEHWPEPDESADYYDGEEWA